MQLTSSRLDRPPARLIQPHCGMKTWNRRKKHGRCGMLRLQGEPEGIQGTLHLPKSDIDSLHYQVWAGRCVAIQRRCTALSLYLEINSGRCNDEVGRCNIDLGQCDIREVPCRIEPGRCEGGAVPCGRR